MFGKNKRTIETKVKSKDGVPPHLVVSVKQISPKKFNITIIHPNTKAELYNKVHLVGSIDAAFALGKQIKEEKFSKEETWHEEILHIPRPKRGKMALKTKEESKDIEDES